MQTGLKTLLRRMLFVLLLWQAANPAFASGSSHPENVFVSYFSGAEIQCEDGDERSELKQVLEDLLRYKPSEMRGRRYTDYAGHGKARSAIDVLHSYVVPKEPQLLDPKSFYTEATKPEAREAISRELKEIDSETH